MGHLMSRACAILFLAVVTGCQLPAEPLPLKPLPEEGQALPYADLATRARLQTTAAHEAFYINNWSDLEEAARALEQTCRFLPKAAEVPARLKDDLETRAADLGKEAAALREAAKAKDATRANEILQRMNLHVRELRAEN
jgi:hypothetical protein